MTTWEHTLLVSDIGGTMRPNVNKVWEQKSKDDKTDWERIQQLGNEGWELVNSFPIAGGNGASWQIVWVLKRHRQ